MATPSAERATCASSYEQAQRLRRAEELLAARSMLLVCSRDACPDVARRDCIQWLGEVEEAIPSATFAARAPDGQDLLDVRVLVDGAPVPDPLNGKPVQMDPGEHRIRFERSSSQPVERVILLREGEHARSVEVIMAPSAAVSAPQPAPRHEDGAGSRVQVPWSAWALVGLGTVGLSSFLYFGISGRSEQVHDLDPCRGTCSASAIDSVRRKYLVADVSLGIAVVSFAAAAWLTLASRRR